jgi:DNA-binding NarL/FixJ family response regulator
MAAFGPEDEQHTLVVAPCALPDDSTDGSGEKRPVDPLPKPRVVLADDSRRMRNVVEQVLSAKCEVEVVGCAVDGGRAIDAVHSLQPDILILDVMMPVLDGIRVTRLLRRVGSPTRIIFLTGIQDSSFQRAAMEAGGQAYVFKNRMFSDLPRAISAVMRGTTFLSSGKS